MSFQPENVPLGNASPRLTGWLDRLQERSASAHDVHTNNFYRQPYELISGLPSGASLTLPDRGGIYDIRPPDISGYLVTMPQNPRPGDRVTVLCGDRQIFVVPFSVEGNLLPANVQLGFSQHFTVWWDERLQSWRTDRTKDYLSYYPQPSGVLPPGGTAFLQTYATGGAQQGYRTSGRARLLPKIEVQSGAGNNAIWRRINIAAQPTEDVFMFSCHGLVEDVTSATVKNYTVQYYIGLDATMAISFPLSATNPIWKGQTSGVIGALGERTFSNYQNFREDVYGGFYIGIHVTSDPGNVGDLQVKNVGHTVEYIETR